MTWCLRVPYVSHSLTKQLQVQHLNSHSVSTSLWVELERGWFSRWDGAAAGRAGQRGCRRPTKPLSRWRPSTYAHAVVRPESGRFATWSRRGPRRKPCAGQSGAFETRARFKSSHRCRILAVVHPAHELSIASYIWCRLTDPQSVQTKADGLKSACALAAEVITERGTVAESGLNP